MNLNKQIIIGKVGKIEELKKTKNGASLISLSIATNYSYKDQSGEKKETTTWFNCFAFGKTAELISQYVVKGQELYVEGRTENDTYEKDGVKFYSSKVHIESFKFGQKANIEQKESGLVQKEEKHETYGFEEMENQGNEAQVIMDIPF